MSAPESDASGSLRELITAKTTKSLGMMGNRVMMGNRGMMGKKYRCPSMVGVPVTTADLRAIADLIEERRRAEIQTQMANVGGETDQAGGRRKTKRRGKKYSRRR